VDSGFYVEFFLNGDDRSLGFASQLKVMFSIQYKMGLGIEYYGFLGTLQGFLPGMEQELLIGN